VAKVSQAMSIRMQQHALPRKYLKLCAQNCFKPSLDPIQNTFPQSLVIVVLGKQNYD